MQQGKLIVVEGPDGLGKSTLAGELFVAMQSLSMPVMHLSFPGRQPGGLGHVVYQIHHNSSSFGIKRISPISLQMLHIAAHVDLIEQTILPSLSAGESIILDRYWWSTLVYGRVYGAQELALTKMLQVELAVWDGRKPDLLVLLKRNEPFVPRPEAKHWHLLSEEYGRMAEAEKDMYPIEIIDLNVSSDGLCPRVFAKMLSVI